MDPWPYRPNKIEHVKSGLKKTDQVNQGGSDPSGGRGEASTDLSAKGRKDFHPYDRAMERSELATIASKTKSAGHSPL